jgi:steroid delta-isomerase-like uncharacterized protein
MSTEENKVSARRTYAMLNSGDLTAAGEVIAADMLEHAPLPGAPPGLAGFVRAVDALRAAFPDLQVTIEDMVAEGDRVATRYTLRGTHGGDFLGIPATGKSVTVSGFDLVRFAHGKVVEHWSTQDDLGLLQQIGLIRLPG